MSVWEQRTNQLRRHNMRASSEALFNELDPEERLQISSALHLHPDMKTHLDRPLVVEAKNGGNKQSRSPDGGREEAGDPRQEDNFHTHSRKHHRHHDRNGESRDGGEGRGGRHHTHHSRSRDHNTDGAQIKDRRGDSSHSRDGGQGHRHHHQPGSPEEDANDFRGGEERGHRHHHSHRSSKEGNGMIANGSQGERRGKGGGGDSNGERKGRCSRMVRAQSTLDGDDCKRNRSGTKGHR